MLLVELNSVITSVPTQLNLYAKKKRKPQADVWDFGLIFLFLSQLQISRCNYISKSKYLSNSFIGICNIKCFLLICRLSFAFLMYETKYDKIHAACDCLLLTGAVKPLSIHSNTAGILSVSGVWRQSVKFLTLLTEVNLL